MSGDETLVDALLNAQTTRQHEQAASALVAHLRAQAAALATASRERDEVLHQLALAEDARERTQREAHERAAEMGAALAAATREGDEARLALRARLNEAPLVYEAQRALAAARRERDEARERAAALHGDGAGHLHRCARVNGQWACAENCPAAALAAAREREARMREALSALVANEGAEAFHYLDRGIGTRTFSGMRWLAARAAAASPDATTKTEP